MESRLFTHAVLDTDEGHCYAGECVETVIAGASFLRLTVPSGAFLFFRGDSLRRITPCTPAFARAAGLAMMQPLAHVHLPDAAADGSPAGEAAATVAEMDSADEAIYQNGYEDGLQAGYDTAMEEYAEAHAFMESEASVREAEAVRWDGVDQRQKVLLPGDPGFPADTALSEFLRGAEAA